MCVIGCSGGSGGGGGGGGGGESSKENSLRREVTILSTLEHPNIIRYYESFQQGSSLFIVMELVEGATLLDHINSLNEKKDTMPEGRVWALFTQICLALRYAENMLYSGPLYLGEVHS